MPPTEQRLSECKHYGKRNFFEWLMDDFPHCKCPNKESGICIWKSDSRANCPDYEPKEKKDNRKIDNVD